LFYVVQFLVSILGCILVAIVQDVLAKSDSCAATANAAASPELEYVLAGLGGRHTVLYVLFVASSLVLETGTSHPQSGLVDDGRLL
jgi:hypothetical protein